MAVRDDEHAARAERARQIGLFRYQLVREAADPELSAQGSGAGWCARSPGGSTLIRSGGGCGISRDTLDRWIRAWRARRVRRAGADPAAVQPTDPGRDDRAGAGVEEGEPGPHRRAGPADPAHPARLGARGTHAATLLRRARPERAARPAARRRCSAGSKPTAPTNSGPGTRCTARGSRPQDLPVRLHRRPHPGCWSGYRLGLSPRTRSGWPPRCGRRWRHAGCPGPIYVDYAENWTMPTLSESAGLLG